MGKALLLTLAVGALTAADLASNVSGSREDDWLSWTVYAVSVLALLGHRRRPLPAAVVAGAGSLTWTLVGHIGELLNLPAMVCLYFVAERGDRRRTLRVAVIAALLSGAAAVVAGQEEGRPVPSPVLEMAIPLVPLLLGEVVRGRHELARRADEERERETARLVREERVRIARELHDIVAHTVTAMTVQAGLALDAFDTRPELARTALAQVRASGREAVRELRTTVTILRDEGGEPAAPAPRLAQLPELVGRVPLRVTLHAPAEGDGPGVPPVVELAAYRIVQEALTNVVKHSGARHAAVSVRAVDGGLLVEVTDEGPAAPSPGTGFGLLGMRERAAAVGGTLEYGALPGGGFRVRALLPVAAEREGVPG
ncbi:sensor histidine kinase [Streptomyces radicis]|uniref:histidine kinase n=1 Tax=Streptomyces radicis TaxID=1750517 RepID=A0A3A9WKV9_9ACTN|nr:sensor histidine kinase [Streptomyces radicis]RKN10094.1 sensor histidine kinase [Streptomyces radicis]RKN24436.1 sensor histidine kinase [Streptomyces radicis]